MSLDRNETLAVIGSVGMGVSHLVFDLPLIFGVSALLTLPLMISNLVWCHKELRRRSTRTRKGDVRR